MPRITLAAAAGERPRIPRELQRHGQRGGDPVLRHLDAVRRQQKPSSTAVNKCSIGQANIMIIIIIVTDIVAS